MTRPLGSLALAFTLVVSGALAACGDGGDAGGVPSSATQVPETDPAPPATAPEGGTEGAPPTPTVAAETVAQLELPIALEPRAGDDHLWVAERKGRVRRLAVGADGQLTPAGAPVLDLTDQTTVDAERGLLDLAFSEDGSSLYVSYTDLDGNTRLVAYEVEGETVDTDSRRVLLAVDQPYPNHNGGGVVLGPDGRLWVGLGDGGSGDDPENRAQDPDTPLGKMVRVDPEADGAPDPEIVVSGLRNPWRFAFDTDGSLWIGDVGQSMWEEVDRLPAEAIEGANLGWSALEGTHENPNVDPEGRRGEDPVPPVFEYSHEGGNCSITGGFVYRGDAIPSLDGAYLFADYCAGRIRALRLDEDGTLAAEYDLGIDVATPQSFGTDADGEPYVLSADGAIVRLTSA